GLFRDLPQPRLEGPALLVVDDADAAPAFHRDGFRHQAADGRDRLCHRLGRGDDVAGGELRRSADRVRALHHSGLTREAREPGIRKHIPSLRLDSGFARCARAGMTKKIGAGNERRREANAALPGALIFRAAGVPVSRFSVAPRMRGWSAGRRQGAGAAPFTGLARPVSRAKIPGPKYLRGWGSRGARALWRESPAPPGAPTRRSICGPPHPAPPSNAAIDDALD